MKSNDLQDVSAERGVLSGIFNYGTEGYSDVSDIVKTESFCLDSNQIIFSCLKKIIDDSDDKITKVDYPSVLSSAKSLGFYDFISRPEEQKHLRSIMQMPIEKENIRRMAGTVKKLEIAREYLGVLELAKSNILEVTGKESLEQIIAKAENPITEYTILLSGASSNSVSLMGEGAEQYFKHLIDNPRENIGIPTPFKRYNKAIGGGLRAGGLDLIGARQKALAYGSKVWTKNGPKFIEDIKIGEEIANPHGSFSKITNIFDFKDKDKSEEFKERLSQEFSKQLAPGMRSFSDLEYD